MSVAPQLRTQERRLWALPVLAVLRPAPEPHALYHPAKRAFDIALGSLFAVAALPIILLAAIAVWCELRCNPFYVQERVGFLGARLKIVKIRTMRPGAERFVPIDLNETGGPTFKSRCDPRITRTGRWIRKTSIDELPQFGNVILGSMSLVGPRPALPHEVAHYTAGQAERLTAKPGLTGLWQISGRSEVPFRTWVALDRVYVRRRTLFLDFAILAKTPWVVLTMRGAW